jgi:GAF domain-containing protein
MRFNVRHKLIAFAFCVALLVGGSIALYSMYAGRQQIILSFEKDARATTDLIARSIADELYFLDIASVRIRLESSRANSVIRYTIVTDANGFVLTDGTRENGMGGQRLADTFSQEMLHAKGSVSKIDSDIFKIGAPIFMPDGSRIGYLLAGFSFAQADQLVRSTTRTSLYITMISIGIGAILAFFFSAGFSRSILSIVRAAKSIGEGKLDTRLEVRRSDELGTLAGSINQMAQALNESYRDLEGKIAERTRDLAALYTALTPIVSAKGDDLIQNVVERLKEATHADAALIRLFDGQTQSYLYPAHIGFPSGYLEATRQVAPDSAIGTTFRTGEAIISANIREDRRLKGKKQLDTGFASCAFLPLRISGELRGIIHLASRKLGHFDESKEDHLLAIARQMGMAMENRELFEEAGRRAQEQQALNVIAKATSQSLHRGELLEIALGKLLEVTGRERASIRLKDFVTGEITLAAHRGFSEEEIEDLIHRVPHHPTDHVFATGQPLVINDRPELGDSQSLLPRSCSVAWIPVKTGVKVLGVLGVSTTRRVHFSQREVDLLLAIGNVIGVAIHNAELYEETQRNLRRIQALREIDQAINSTLNLRQVLDVLLEKIEVFLPYASATTVRLFNKQTEEVEPVTCRNLDEQEWKAQPWKVAGGNPNLVFSSGRPVTVTDLQTDPRTTDAEFFRRYGLISYLGVPLIVHGETLGVLSLYAKERREFSEQEINFLLTLAGQASIAIHNSQLYQDAQNRETHLQETNRMLSALHSVAAAASQSLDLNEVLQAVIGKITEVFGFDATRIHLWDAAAGEMSLKASFEGDPDRFTMAKTFKMGEGVVGKVVESGTALIFEDVETDSLYRHLSRSNVSNRLGLHFFAVFPIKGKRRQLGTLGCVGAAPRKLSENEIRLLEALADQIAISIENSELYNTVKEKAEELQEKTSQLEKANTAKDEFLSTMSHELRTPLNVVIGYAAMLKDGMLGNINVEQESALNKVLARADEQLRMINSILQATQIGAGAVAVRKEVVNLNELLDEIKSSYDYAPDKQITFQWEYSPDLPLVHTDGDKVKHIVQNIIGNAVKFTEKGRITTSVRHIARPDVVEFKVTDTGAGIPKAMLPIVFEKFRQVDSSARREFEGVGLGLYIVKQLTNLLGGKAEVDSEEGRGSTFTVTIPVEIATVNREPTAVTGGLALLH